MIDNASRRGVFENEYFGDVPARRWLITKLDLLILEHIGYNLAETSSLIPLSIESTNLSNGAVATPYSEKLIASGGIPFYYWMIESGELPDGLSLDSFNGEISGTPAAAGSSNFTVRVFDYDNNSSGFARSFSITINSDEIVVNPGDANGDGEVNILDVTYVLNHILAISSAHGNADCNEDGAVDILDVTCVLNKILGN